MSTDTTLDQPTADAVKARRGRPPKATPAAANGAAPKRSGRPAAPQTKEDAVAQFLTRIQTARKALYDARGLLARIPDLEGDNGTINWEHAGSIEAQLRKTDYTLHAAQTTIGRTGFSNPTDKI